MRTFYYRVNDNFGDHLNGRLWPRLFPTQLAGRQDDVLVGIGTLIKNALNDMPGRKIVFGTGTGYGDVPRPQAVADWIFYFVRGPLTARALGLDADKGVIDGAWLVDQLDDLRYRPVTQKGIVFVPHWTTDLSANWRQPCLDAGIRYVSPLVPDPVLPAIAGAELAIVESLHGAIMADYYRVPWIPVATSDRVLSFKWLDFCMSLEMQFRPIQLPVSDWIERRLTGSGRPWSGGVDYLRESIESDFTEVHDTKPPKPQPRKTLARTLARALRDASHTALRRVRDTPLARGAFAGRSAELAELLLKIAREPAQLSGHAIRQEKLERLDNAVRQLRRDFPEG